MTTTYIELYATSNKATLKVTKPEELHEILRDLKESKKNYLANPLRTMMLWRQRRDTVYGLNKRKTLREYSEERQKKILQCLSRLEIDKSVLENDNKSSLYYLSIKSIIVFLRKLVSKSTFKHTLQMGVEWFVWR